MTMMAFLLPALYLFILRLVDIAFATLRLTMVVQGRKALAWVFACLQSFLFVIILQMVLSDLGDWLKIVAYAAGFASGLVVGMWVDERLAIGYTHLRVFSPGHGAELSERLRVAGYGVTEFNAMGKDGMVTMLTCSVQRRQAPEVRRIVEESDPQAFITAQAVRSVQRGFWNGK